MMTLRTLVRLPCLLGGMVVGSTIAFAAPNPTQLLPTGATRGTTTTIQANGTFERWPVQVWSSSKSVTVTAAKEKGKFQVVVASDAIPGLTWLRFHDETGVSPLRPFFVGNLPEVSEAEPNEDPARAQLLTAPAIVTGKLAKSGDVDCFSVPVKKGQILVASLVANEILRSPIDAVLQVVTPEGIVLEQNHDHHGLDPQVSFTAPSDGTYIVRLFAFPSQPDSTIRFFGSDAAIYRLTITTGGWIETATPLAVEAKKPVTLNLVGANLPTPIASLNETQETFAPAWSATAFTVKRLPHPTIDLTQGAPKQPLSIPFTATGRLLKPKSVDAITVVGTKSKPWTIRLESMSLDLALTPVVRVLDAKGQQLGRYEPQKLNGDCEASFTPSADGTYTIEVADLHRQGSLRHAYRLTVTPSMPDVTATVASDRFTLAGDQPLELPITLARVNGLNDDLDVAVEGLPATITASVVPPKGGKPDPKTITLKLQGKAGTFSGPIQIVVKSKKDPTLKRLAKSLIATGDELTTTDLWLTAVPTAAPPPPAKK